MGKLLFAFILAGVALILGLQFWMKRKARGAEGRPVPEGVDPSAGRTTLYYFFGARCGVCRGTTPIVDRLIAEQGDAVRKVDVAEQTDLARGFGVMGTPTFVTVRDGQVGKVILGAATEAQLRKLLEP